MKGKVKDWLEKKGFGFIVREDDKSEIFFHESGIKTPGYKPEVGDEVSFNVGKGPKGPRAEVVTFVKKADKTPATKDNSKKPKSTKSALTVSAGSETKSALKIMPVLYPDSDGGFLVRFLADRKGRWFNLAPLYEVKNLQVFEIVSGSVPARVSLHDAFKARESGELVLKIYFEPTVDRHQAAFRVIVKDHPEQRLTLFKNPVSKTTQETLSL